MSDETIGSALVWALVNGLWLAAVMAAFSLGAVLAWWRQQRRPGGLTDQHTAVARLTVRLSQLEAEPGIATAGEVHELRLQAFLARQVAQAANHRAQHASDHALALAEDVVALQHQLGRALDVVKLAELEASTKWEELEPPVADPAT